jgi:hypothetical protein
MTRFVRVRCFPSGYLPAQTFCVAVEVPAHLLQLLHDRPSVLKQHRSSRRKLNAAAASHQQLCSKRGFHRTNTFTRCRERHIGSSSTVRDVRNLRNVKE